MTSQGKAAPINPSQEPKGPEEEHAELFDDDENEQFIRSLDNQNPPEKALASDQIDEILPDAPASDEPDLNAPSSDTSSPDGSVSDNSVPDSSLQESSANESQSQAAEETADPIVAPLDQEQKTGPVEETIEDVNQVPLPIALEVGKVTCSLKKLLNLKENDVLELDQPLSESVDLRLEGKLIGKAQLVRLGEQLGLRIIDLYQQ